MAAGVLLVGGRKCELRLTDRVRELMTARKRGTSIASRYSRRRHRTSRLAPYARADSVVIQKLVGQSV